MKTERENEMTGFVVYDEISSLLQLDQKVYSRAHLANVAKLAKIRKLLKHASSEGERGTNTKLAKHLRDYFRKNQEMTLELARHIDDNWTVISLEEYNATMRTTKTVRNLMTGKEAEIDINTPLSCDPSSETYWSM